MMNSKALSTGFQSQFISNSCKNAFTSSPSPLISFDYPTTNFKNPLISIRKHPNLPPKSAAANSFPTDSSEETLYDLLAMPQNGTLSDIKRAYKQMALKYHPDVSPPDQIDEYTARFIQIKKAYETLSNPVSRAVYDSNLAKGLHLAFSGENVSGFEGGIERWKQSWEVQVEELKPRSTAETERVGRGGQMSWAARVRKQRRQSQTN